jgi:hypothetical protein
MRRRLAWLVLPSSYRQVSRVGLTVQTRAITPSGPMH